MCVVRYETIEVETCCQLNGPEKRGQPKKGSAMKDRHTQNSDGYADPLKKGLTVPTMQQVQRPPAQPVSQPDGVCAGSCKHASEQVGWRAPRHTAGL